ncbi:steroid 5-alpha reductase family enzyme [Litorivivens lipolytica]|uniref:Steroid 5-alpha reductase family enzyme n=1 Tax=Litorivivens lipolytica TaxID=1524264 RepID=A0A7W4W5F4_9GAMM|nr:DUF1295 domain-containing protein [Litorivivens lipolytica]MBB3047811.1 steroid 5-alpha reductase family enzyme [Litorivivens lipolytica]
MAAIFRALIVILVSVGLALGLALVVDNSQQQLFGLPALVALALVALGIQWLVFIPSYLFQTEIYYDLTGSLTYLLVTGVAVAFLAGSEPSLRAVLLAALVVIWALRLGPFLFRRIKKAGKDGRFDEIKTRWPRFLVTWTLQGLWVFITLLAALVAITTPDAKPLGVTALIGFAMWLIGFTFEAVADAQKSAFNSDPANQGRFVDVGLWRWSRHPNYFGEILLWMGVAVIAAPVFQGLQWLALISPLFVIFLLMKVSGVPLLEKRADEKWGDSPEYQRYKKDVPVLLPRPPR